MSIGDNISRDTKEAMRDRDRPRVEALRLLSAALKNAEIEKGEPLAEDEELARVIDEAIQETGAASMRDMGAVMGRARERTGGRADGQRLSALARERLQG